MEDTNRCISRITQGKQTKKSSASLWIAMTARCRPSGPGDHGEVALRDAGSEHGGMGWGWA